MRSFQEYLSGKGSMQEKPHVKLVADKVEQPKGNGGAKIPKEGRPMKNGKQAQIKEGKKSRKCEKGFGDQGDKALIYDVEKDTKPAKLPTAESYTIFPMVRESLQNNPALIEALVRDLKRNGLLGLLVGELSQHNETFRHLADVMGHGEHGASVCRRFARAMKENVSLPFAQTGNGEVDPMADPNMDPNAALDPDADPMMGDDEDVPPPMDDEDEDMMGDDEEGMDDGIPEEDPMADPNADPNDPNAMLDPSMDPNADPSMMGMPPMGDPSMNGPLPPLRKINPALENFNRAWKLVR